MKRFLLLAIFIFTWVPVVCADADYESHLRKFSNWESNLFHVGKTNEDWYITKYPVPHPPELFAFSVHSVYPDCDLIQFSMYLFGTKIINYEKNNLPGEITIDGNAQRIAYNFFSAGTGMYFIEILTPADVDIVSMMVKGRTMRVQFPFLMVDRSINLTGFTKALDRSTMMCISGTGRR